MMDLDPRTPVLVGIGAVQQRCDDPREALEPLELMIAALRRAGEDSGNAALLAQADSIRVPRGFWDYSDPGRLIAQRFGAERARTQLAEIGVLQTTLFGEAVRAIAAGEEHVVLVVGGEAKHRSLRAQISGLAAPLTEQTGVEPDSVLVPAREIWSPLEADLGLLMPVNQYSIVENALRYDEGISIAEHRREIAELWAGFSRVAAENPNAWTRKRLDADAILSSEDNRMLAFPYAKLHNSQWNVDQAAGLIFCSLAAARRAAIAEERWVYPLSVAESNYMVPLSQRRELHRSPGFRIAARCALDAAGLKIEDVAHLELYSCFPSAVRVQMREIGVIAGRPLTVTGGMAFAGGPLNNFVLQALVRMAEVLRHDRRAAGMVTAVSGMLTKQGVSVWSTQAPKQLCRFADVTEEVSKELEQVEVVSGYQGTASVASYTVIFENGVPSRAVVICDLPDGRRTLASTTDSRWTQVMTEREFCGAAVKLGPKQSLVEITPNPTA